MKKLLIIILALVIITIILFCGKGKDPEYFNNLLDEMVQTANKKDIDGFMDYFSADYKDESGLNYIFIKKIVRDHYEKFDRFEVAYEEVSVSIEKNSDNEDVAKLDLELVVTGVKDGTLSSELIGRSGHFRFLTIYFKKSGFGSWKINEIEGFEQPLY